MKSPWRSISVAGPAIVVTVLAAGALAGALALPLPAAVVGLAVVLLGLRVGVMVAALDEAAPAPAQPIRPAADGRGPALRAANG